MASSIWMVCEEILLALASMRSDEILCCGMVLEEILIDPRHTLSKAKVTCVLNSHRLGRRRNLRVVVVLDQRLERGHFIEIH
jgi:hypothetical protein